MNKWKIPDSLEQEIRARDRACVYCGTEFVAAVTATWEHIVNDARIITPENIALCCAPCNASKGARALADWLASAYCQRRGISRETVADVVKRALVSLPVREA